MLHLGSIYLTVKDINKSTDFYTKLLSMKPTATNLDRWVQFSFEGHCIALYNDLFDQRMIKSNKNLEQHYNDAYLDYLQNRHVSYGNNFVLNFCIKDLNKEYERVSQLNIGELSKIKYVNIAMPYYFFTIDDPDGNMIEITGQYTVE